MELYHDIPESQGVANALKRAAQMRDLWWTAIRPMPSGLAYVTPEGEKGYFSGTAPMFRPQRGVNYSSVRLHEKFVGYNVSIETYLSALANPNSCLYTKFQHKNGLRMYSYYGIVCSCFVSYVTGRPYRTPCAAWPKLPAVEQIDTTDLNKLKLCDIVLNPKQHITIITDIQRDIEGNVQLITVSESSLPYVTSATYTPEQFRSHWKIGTDYSVYRYHEIDKVTYTPTPFAPVPGDPYCGEAKINSSIMTDFGNKANYELGVDPVEVTFLEEGWDALRVTGPDGIRVYEPQDGKALPETKVPGFYTAVATKRSGEVSDPLEWCVTDLHAETDKAVYKPGEPVRIRFRNSLPDEVFHLIINNHTDNIRHQQYLTEDEKKAGCFTAEENPGYQVPGKYRVLLIAHGKYGCYASGRCEFTVEES